MKSTLYWLVLIVSIAVLVSSCSSEDSKTASTDNTTSSSGGSSSTTELEGTWVVSCYSSGSKYLIKTITVSGTNVTDKYEYHLDSSCATDYDTWETTYTSLAIGEAQTFATYGSSGGTGHKFTMTVDTNTYTPLSASNVTWSNDNSFCGESDWVLNTPQSIAGKTCGGGTWWNLNIAIYGMYILDGTKLIPSFQSSTSGSYPSSVSSSTSNIYIKQSDFSAPTVSSVSTTADNQSSVSITDNITVTFSEAMDTTYVTTSTSDTNCAGTIRVSSDNFSSCVKMSSEPASSNSNKTFTLDPYDNLTVSTTYKTRVTTGVKDTAGNALNSQYETSSGFTTLAPTVLYETTTPTRSGNNIVYSQNNSTSYSDSDLQADGARIGYRMEVTDNGTDYYAETIFDAWDGITLSSLLFPTVSNANVIQRTVTNMSVDSNYPTVTNTSSTSGRLEIWPWNYGESAQNNIGGDNSKYDFDDRHHGSSSYGSMQVHNLSAAQTVMAWNNHSASQPDIGLGNNPASTGNNKHPDWTFSGGSSLGTSNWKFQVLLILQQ